MRKVAARIAAVVVDWRGELRAGFADAIRTPRPRPLAGRKWGDMFYATGYFVGATINRRRSS